MSPSNSPTIWDRDLLADPHHVADKPQRVRRMFAAIAGSYDLNNRLHSLGLDQRWRNQAVKMADLRGGEAIVDVACGTGDLTLKLARQVGRISGGSWPPPRAIGIDFTYEMLPIACAKAQRRHRRRGPHAGDAVFIAADALNLPLADASADVVTIAFGIRNISEPSAAIAEFFRILRPGGRLIILEFSLPGNRVLGGLYNFYFNRILPRTATWISRDTTGAYRYLPQSVSTFLSPSTMAELLRRAGFSENRTRGLSAGICTCYRAVKPAAA